MALRLFYSFFLFLSLGVVGCGSGSDNSISYYQKGFACSYTLEENGKLLSSNARYDRNALTAAHKNLPYGTKIVVTNLSNGRSTIVTINDHDILENNCIVKLSEKALQELALSSETEVTIDIVSWG